MIGSIPRTNKDILDWNKTHIKFSYLLSQEERQTERLDGIKA
jgi:hypothetical protein